MSKIEILCIALICLFLSACAGSNNSNDLSQSSQPTPSTPAPSATPVADANQIKGPGIYALQNDISGDLHLTTYSNVTLLGNNHTVSGALYVGNGDATTGIVVQDLTVHGILAVGNSSTAKTDLAIHLKNITNSFTPNNFGSGTEAGFSGSNMLIEYCNFEGSSQTDDPVQLGATVPNNYVTFDHCTFGQNSDLGLEGIGAWNHVTVSNCTAVYGGIGGYYGTGWPNDRSPSFHLTNSTFVNNRILLFAFFGTGAGTDEIATAHMSTGGNIFSGNTYGRP